MNDATVYRFDEVVGCFQTLGLGDASPGVQREFFRAVSTYYTGMYSAKGFGLPGGIGRIVRTKTGRVGRIRDAGIRVEGDVGCASEVGVGVCDGSEVRSCVGVAESVGSGGEVPVVPESVVDRPVGGDGTRVGGGAAGFAAGSCVDREVRKVGKWRRKNLKKKENRAERVRDGSWRQETLMAVAGKSEAQRTLEAKWVVENKLKAFEAERKLELLKLQDVSEVAKLQERKLKAAGERAMVQIEKSHATLAATGNVPGVVPKGGYCVTVVDDPGLSDGSSPSCTISPDSSASMKEFRECQKALADAEAMIEKQRKENAVLRKKYRGETRLALDAGAEVALTWNFDEGPTESVKEFMKGIPYEVEQDRDIVIGQITLKKDYEALYADDGCGGDAFGY